MAGPERNRIEPRVGAMRRRDFVALVAATLAMGSVKAPAQSSTRRPLIAVLLGGSAYAAELVDLSPDLIFAFFNAQLAPLSRETRTIPIVFVGASDPVGAGYVASFARPGGNITGFTLYEPSFVGKWLGVLKETAPPVARVAIMVNPDTAILRGTFYLSAFETAAATFKV